MNFFSYCDQKSIRIERINPPIVYVLLALCLIVLGLHQPSEAQQNNAMPQYETAELPSGPEFPTKERDNVTFDILTYNIKMLGFPSNKKNKARAKQMISKLGGSKTENDNYDVITIQELYTNRPQKILLQGPTSGLFNREGGLMNKYGYEDYVSKRELLIVSNWPIIEHDWYKFNNNRGLRVRGVLYANISKNGLNYHVFTTHLWWDKRWKNLIGPDKCGGYKKDENVRVQQMKEIDNYIERQNIPDGEPIFITGDFNFGGPGDSRYQNCKNKGYNVKSYKKFKQLIEADQMVQMGGVGWFNDTPWPGTTSGTRTLDHIFHRNLGSFEKEDSYLRPQFFTTNMSLGGGFHHDDFHNLSDHDPVKGHFEFDMGWDLKAPNTTSTLSKKARGWIGRYYGRNDGRKSKLEISTNEDQSQLEIVFQDLDRNTRLTGTVYASDFNNAADYVIKDLKLTNGGCTSWSPDGLECKKKTFERLYLHTWDNDHISGFTEWSGTDYGVAFSEDGLSDLNSNRFNGNKWIREWTGTYKGREDGRNAKLVIEQRGNNLHFTLNSMDRNKKFTATIPISNLYGSPKHIFRDLVLTTDSGHKKQIERLYLHTWNTNYISGYTQWSGNNYGNYFVASGD